MPELKQTDHGLVLAEGELEVYADFERLLPRASNARVHQELLVKAAKIKGTPATELLVADATAGFGEDSFLLAAAGFTVTMIERDDVIAALVRDALKRGATNEKAARATSHMQLVEGDSIQLLPALNPHPDIVYLDPMFPERTKSASVKKKFQLIHGLEAPCEDEEALLEAALSARPRKIVIKRPLKGPFLAGRKPDYSLSGKAIRYDVLTFAEQQ